ncbi:MAG: glucose-6-phosphate isomerase [Clostridia bacterium]|nr:glucose-6-phosphate isomerase [Clostridia bacterium]
MHIDLSHSKITPEGGALARAEKALQTLREGTLPNTGWVSLPSAFPGPLLLSIQEEADRIARKCTLFIVVGVGGSYLGARAVIDALNGNRPGRPHVMFAGYNMTGAHLEKVIEAMREQSTCLCVISKSGSTLEPLLAYSILKEEMFNKYGEQRAKERIYVVTGAQDSPLRRDIETYGFRSYAVPEDIGGRYSVLSVVGLLPIAVAGIDIERLLKGAAGLSMEGIAAYAAVRIALQEAGKAVEVFTYFSTNLRYFGEWLKQLFGESEGKEGKGVYPACLCFSRDLHSIGQFLQQGRQVFYETMIQTEKPQADFRIPDCAGAPYAGRMLEEVNRCSEAGVVEAHSGGGVPVNLIKVERMDEENLGALIYFFELSAAVSALLLGVDPFDQPGVEYYKKATKKLVEEL